MTTREETIVFWNSGMSSAARRVRPQTGIPPENVVQSLLEAGPTLLGLCEVNRKAVSQLVLHFPRNFLVRDFVGKRGRFGRWDFALAHDKERWIPLDDGAPVTTSQGTRTYGAAYRVAFRHAGSRADVVIYLVHWRSRLSPGTDHRIQCSKGLGARIQEDLRTPGRHVLVMGDFNDEPFDESVGSVLSSTRDRTVALKSDRLYNPFWRHLGGEGEDDFACGTHYHRTGEDTRWRTYDQILVSSHFLGGANLRYVDAGRAQLRSLHYDPRHDCSNHFPVAVTLRSNG